MKLIKIYSDKIRIKSDAQDLGDLSVNSMVKVVDDKKAVSMICVVTAIAKDENERFDFDGDIVEVENESTIDCAVIGSIKHEKFKKSIDTYPSTNVRIEIITEESFKTLFSNPQATDFKIGTYAYYDSDAFIDGNKFFQKHAAIVGSSGSGKSFTVASILEKLSELKSANIILFDIHGEYSRLSYVKGVKIGGDGLDFPLWFLPLKDIYSNILSVKEETSPNQIAALRKAFIKARESAKSEEIPLSFHLQEMIQFLENENNLEVSSGETYKTGAKAGCVKTVKGDNNGKLTSVINALENKLLDRRFDFMTNHHDQTYLETFIDTVYNIDEKNVKVIDFSNVPHDMIPVVVGVLAKMLYKVQLKQEREGIIPLSLICDEAHIYIPASDFGLGAGQRRLLEIFETIAKEGRKFGMTMIPVSQRPTELNRTILAQCANFIVLKMSNDADKQMIKGLLPDNSSGMIDAISLFAPGDCLIVGDSAEMTLKVTVDLPSEAPSGNTIDTWDTWMENRTLNVEACIQKIYND